MIFIPPMEIATKIMTLVDNAETELILVSPYINIDKWAKFKKCIQRAIDRNVQITIYARENADQNLDYIKQLKVNLILVKDLHAKIYLNETYAIATSQNLIEYSDSNSIDFGYYTENDKERNELLTLINKYLAIQKPTKSVPQEKNSSFLELQKSTDANLLFLNDNEIEKIYTAFKERYSTIKKNNDSTYVFCIRLFPFADVMIREGYELRFRSNIREYSSIIETLENLTLDNNHYKYKVQLKMKNDFPDSLIFIPKGEIKIEKLINDYIFMTQAIVNETLSVANKTEHLYQNEKIINREDSKLICKAFNEEFPKSDCKVKSNYLFSSNLFSFADVLIHNEYQLKIETNNADFLIIEEMLEKMDFYFNYKFDRSSYKEYDSRIYINFTPQKFDDLNLLISDYIAITKYILKNTASITGNN